MQAEDRPAAPTDEEIVERVLGGETALYEVLMRRHNRRLFRVARTIVDDADEAEDVMQDTYVRAYVNLRQFAGRARFSSWLTRIAVHEALARARRRGRIVDIVHGDDEEAETDSMDRFPSSGPGPAEQVLGREVRDLLEKAVSGLAPMYRSVFVLREVEGLSIAETAASLGIREGAVKVRLHRARAMLRDDLLERAGSSLAEILPFHESRCDRVVAGVFRRIRAGDLPPVGALPF
jgi:RNA polymerase sigma-70 factor (ECF subfamily)